MSKFKNFKMTPSGPVISIRTKIWLDVNGQNLIGEGRARLLRLVQETGSINAASKKMNLSYRKAWSIIRDMEVSLGTELVEKQRGGTGGGNAVLTPTALDLLERYELILSEYNDFFK